MSPARQRDIEIGYTLAVLSVLCLALGAPDLALCLAVPWVVVEVGCKLLGVDQEGSDTHGPSR